MQGYTRLFLVLLVTQRAKANANAFIEVTRSSESSVWDARAQALSIWEGLCALLGEAGPVLIYSLEATLELSYVCCKEIRFHPGI